MVTRTRLYETYNQVWKVVNVGIKFELVSLRCPVDDLCERYPMRKGSFTGGKYSFRRPKWDAA